MGKNTQFSEYFLKREYYIAPPPPKVPPGHEADCCAGKEERQRKLLVLPDFHRLGRVNGEIETEEKVGKQCVRIFSSPKKRAQNCHGAQKTALAKHAIMFFFFFERFNKIYLAFFAYFLQQQFNNKISIFRAITIFFPQQQGQLKNKESL